VADNGIGIPADSIPFVFDRFYRADKARSRATGGIGIGLSIVKAICNAHNAEINVQSREGKGSVFTVSFPVCRLEAIARSEDLPSRQRLSASAVASTSASR
jgi:two-component system phosphate regulon sensor histidine kinase PhoR